METETIVKLRFSGLVCSLNSLEDIHRKELEKKSWLIGTTVERATNFYCDALCNLSSFNLAEFLKLSPTFLGTVYALPGNIGGNFAHHLLHGNL